MVFIEAMAAGLPIIAADSGGPKEIVVHEQNGLLVKPNDVSALALAMRRFLEQDFLCARMGRTAREHVEAKFSLQKMVHEHLLTYERVIGVSHRAS
jgi:glycosyltransferase involved in cell wall biosynthesis